MDASRSQASTDITVDTDSDSALGDDASVQSDLTSLRSTIFNYHYQNGRRYHAYHAGSYWGPNDEKAMDGLDLWHHICLLMLGGRLNLAPIGPHPERVLDVGTGTGIWAIDFADQYPSSAIIGTDLSPIQPSWTPPNLSFEISDCCEEWLFRRPFDFIHVRALYGSVGDWDAFYAQVVQHLKPGAWVEQTERSVVPRSDDGSTVGTIMEKWGDISITAGERFGKSLKIVDQSADHMRRAGLVDVVERRFKVPVGGWAKDKHLKHLGKWVQLEWEDGIEGWTMMLLTNILGWQPEEVQVYLAEMRRGLRDKRIHAYHEATIVYGRKPYPDEVVPPPSTSTSTASHDAP